MQDRDGDTLACPEDCDDSDPALQSVPGEVLALSLTGPDTLAWLPPQNPGGTAALAYDTLRAGRPDLGESTCIEAGGSDTGTTDVAVPAPASAFHYLVRARNGCGPGSLGQRSSGEQRVASPCP